MLLSSRSQFLSPLNRFGQSGLALHKTLGFSSLLFLGLGVLSLSFGLGLPSSALAQSASGTGGSGSSPGVTYSNSAPTSLTQVSPTSKIACDPQIKQEMIQQAIAATKNDIATNDAIRRKILQPPPSSLMSCVNSNWPSLSLSFPTMDQLLKQAEQYVINQACTYANNAISQVENPITSYAGAWGSIPGLGSSYGGQVGFNGGSMSHGGSAGSGTCTTVNGHTTCTPPPTSGGLSGIL